MAVYIGLGANMGEAAASIRRALGAVAALPGVSVQAVSPFYRTEPQGLREQPWFVNAVARLGCADDWTPCALVEAFLRIEAGLGRVRPVEPHARPGPRPIDIDLLLFNDVVSTVPECRVPHPMLLRRAFVLVPLRDIAPEVMVAPGVTPGMALERLDYTVRGDEIRQPC